MIQKWKNPVFDLAELEPPSLRQSKGYEFNSRTFSNRFESIDRAMIERLLVIGQLDEKFIVAKDTSKDRCKLVIIDQHAADER